MDIQLVTTLCRRTGRRSLLPSLLCICLLQHLLIVLLFNSNSILRLHYPVYQAILNGLRWSEVAVAPNIFPHLLLLPSCRCSGLRLSAQLCQKHTKVAACAYEGTGHPSSTNLAWQMQQQPCMTIVMFILCNTTTALTQCTHAS